MIITKIPYIKFILISDVTPNKHNNVDNVVGTFDFSVQKPFI